jgi:Zn-dependent protease
MLYRLLIFFLALVSRALILTAVMPLACYAKVWTAKKLGDRTAERAGRLSLDFRKHTDFFGIIVILAFGFGWSKEINIDVSRLKNMKRDVTLISLASPLTYFLMYIILRNVGGAVLSISPDVFILQCVCAVLNKAAFASLFFGVIALLPIPPLDGFHIFYQFSWPKFRRWYFTNYQKITVWSRYILIFIFFMGSITDGAFSVLDLLGNLWRLLLDRLVFFGTGPIQIF